MAAPHQAALAKVPFPTSITVRGLDPAVKERLRVRAARHGRSMEAEARAILEAAVLAPAEAGVDLAERIRARFAPFGGVKLPLPPRGPGREPPAFGE